MWWLIIFDKLSYLTNWFQLNEIYHKCIALLANVVVVAPATHNARVVFRSCINDHASFG